MSCVHICVCRNPLKPLYDVSYTWMGLIGVCSSVLVGCITSLIVNKLGMHTVWHSLFIPYKMLQSRLQDISDNWNYFQIRYKTFQATGLISKYITRHFRQLELFPNTLKDISGNWTYFKVRYKTFQATGNISKYVTRHFRQLELFQSTLQDISGNWNHFKVRCKTFQATGIISKYVARHFR